MDQHFDFIMDHYQHRSSVWFLSGFNSSEDYRLELFRSLDIMCFVVYGLVFVVGALGNGVVIWATAFKLKRTSSTVWFLNLAASDLLFAATLPLGIMHQALDFEWPLGRVMCKLYLTLDSLTMFASVYLLVVISVDRCVSVAWPSSAWVQKNRRGGAWRRKASYVSVAGVWALAAVLGSPLFAALDTPPSRWLENSTECMVMFINSTSAAFSDYLNVLEFESSESNSDYLELSQVRLNEQALNVSYFLLGYVVPLVVIVSCYAVILWRRNAVGGVGSHRSPLGRPFSVAAAVTASFFLCFGPYHVTSVFYAAPGEDDAFDALHAVWTYAAGCLEALYRCLNPLLYVTVRRNLRNKESVLEVLESAFAEEEEPRSEPSADLPLSDKE